MRIEIQKDSCLIENGIVQKNYILEKNRLRGFSLTHCQSGKTLAFDRESELFSLHFQGAFGGETVKASELKIQETEKKEAAQSATLILVFKPFKVRGCKLFLRFEETIGAFDSFLQSRLFFSAEPGSGDSAILDFIDFAPLAFCEGAQIWTAPQSEKNKTDAALRLGQPVFYENCFFGCAFPASCSGTKQNRLFLRRYYGRSLAGLLGADGSFCSDSAVCGAAPDADYLTVRERFFTYLEKTSLPATRQFSLQLQTDPQALEPALLQTEKSWQKAGLPFAKTILLNKRQILPEQTLWSFPDTLPPSLLALQKRAASLGVSLGLQLGSEPEKSKGLFGLQPRFASAKEEVCPADGAFLQKLQDFLRLCMENGITSFCFDLPFLRPCREKAHRHARGGEKQLYYYSDLWEKWINLLSALRRTSNRPLHIVLQGAPLSPWLLQWADTLMLPESRQKSAGRMDFAAKQTLLDAERFRCLKTLSLCFPQNRLFTALQFDEKAADSPAALPGALAANALCAGEQLLIAPPAAAEKAAPALRGVMHLLGDTQAVLRRGVMFGGDPAQNEFYGFSAFDGAGGILVLRNPNSLAATVSFALDTQCGVPKQFSAAGLCSLIPLLPQTDAAVRRCGDLLSEPLAPGETVVLQLGRRTKPLAATAFAENETALRVFCNQPLDFSDAICEGNVLQSAERLPDACAVKLRFAYPFHTGNELQLRGVKDLLQNEATLTLRFAAGSRALLPNGTIKGTGPFSIRVTIGGESNADFYLQGNQIALQSRGGYACFRVGDTILHARTGIADVVQICAVREVTGALKLYLNQRLDCSVQPVGAPEDVKPAAPLCFDPGRTKLFDRALGFDEV